MAIETEKAKAAQEQTLVLLLDLVSILHITGLLSFPVSGFGFDTQCSICCCDCA